MKSRLLLQLLMLSKNALYGFILQCFLINLLWATNTSAQKIQSVNKVTVNLNLENASLPDLFQEIASQTNFTFSYIEEDLDRNYRINKKTKKAILADVLLEISRDARLKFKQVNNNINVSPLIDQPRQNRIEVIIQSRTVSGQITSQEEGEPLPGVNVIEKGTDNGTVSDVNGEYSLQVTEGAVLIFSSVGYTTEEIAVGSRSVVDVSMADDIQRLEELVVIGYGTQSKVTVTGSVVSTEGEEIVKSRTPNVLNSMTGHLPGLIINNRSGEPGRDEPNIFIRGRSTTGDASPLIIIDGVERDDLGRINPNDIESISVLKDASAAIYGARAANGVILVTTKRGSRGAPAFNFSINQGFSQPTRNPKMADAYTFAKVYNEIEEAEGRAPRYTDDELERFRERSDPNYQTTDWYDVMTKKLTPQRQTSLSVTGGNESLTYYLSLGELSQDGHFNYGSTKVKRYNFRSNIDVNVTDFFKVGLDLSGRLDDKHYPGNPDTRGIYSHMFLYQPNWTLFWPGTDYLRPNRDNESLVNWVSDASGWQDETYKAMESRLHFDLAIPWVQGLSLSGSANYDAGYNFIKYWDLPTFVYYYDDVSEVYTQGRSGDGADLAQLEETFDQNSILTLNAQINYEQSFGAHNLGLMLGYEQMEYDYNFFSAYRTDFPSTALPQLFAGSSDKMKQGNDGSAGITSRKNYFGRITYDYDHKYLAQLIFRYDGSPNFPENKRWGFFPGISLGWRVSEEPWMDGLGFIDDLKIRGSYGEMGNDSIPAFQYITSYGYGNNYVIGNNDVIGLVQSGAPNPNITWEVAKMTNIGLELSLWEGRFELGFDYFNTRRSNILTKRTAVIPDYTGLVLPDENVGIVENKGFELLLSHRRSLERFTYSISGNVSFARNKVIFADEAPAAEEYQLATGRPINAGLYYKAIGIFSDLEEINSYPTLPGARPGDIIYEDVNGDGILNSRDQVRLDQTATPEIVYGINASIGFANFDLSVLFQGQENAMASFDGVDNYFPVMNYNLGNFLAWRANGRWTPENTDASQPRGAAENANNNTQPSTHWTMNAGFLRLKNVEIGYTFPENISRKIGMQYLRAYVSGNNLALLYDHMKDLGFDPETSDYWFYPQQRTFNVGVNLTF